MWFATKRQKDLRRKWMEKEAAAIAESAAHTAAILKPHVTELASSTSTATSTVTRPPVVAEAAKSSITTAPVQAVPTTFLVKQPSMESKIRNETETLLKTLQKQLFPSTVASTSVSLPAPLDLSKKSTNVTATAVVSNVGVSPPQQQAVVTPNALNHEPTKRYRTQLTPEQIRVMREIFVDFKTPSQHECFDLGRELGLSKRVVQVWFQNMRAKEKKVTGVDTFRFPSCASTFDSYATQGCRLCDVTFFGPSDDFSNSKKIRMHLFSKAHIRSLRKKVGDVLVAEVERFATYDTAGSRMSMAAAVAIKQEATNQSQVNGEGSSGAAQRNGEVDGSSMSEYYDNYVDCSDEDSSNPLTTSEFDAGETSTAANGNGGVEQQQSSHINSSPSSSSCTGNTNNVVTTTS